MSEETKDISEDFKAAVNVVCKLATERGYLFFAAADNGKTVFNSTNVETGRHGDFLLDVAKGVYSVDREDSDAAIKGKATK